jgi:hypothetical protein
MARPSEAHKCKRKYWVQPGTTADFICSEVGRDVAAPVRLANADVRRFPSGNLCVDPVPTGLPEIAESFAALHFSMSFPGIAPTLGELAR